MGWWLQAIGGLFAAFGSVLAVWGFLISPQENVVNSIKNLFTISSQVNKGVRYPVVNIGGARFVLQGTSNPFPYEYLGRPLIEDPISVWIENDQLKVSMIVRNVEGKVIAKVDANNVTVNSNATLNWNYDNEGFEIINEYDEVVLQVQLKNGVVDMAGIFIRSDGVKVAIVPAPNNDGAYFEIRGKSELLDNKINRVFKYSGSRYLHQRI